MSNIADGIKYALEQSRREREQTKEAEIKGDEPATMEAAASRLSVRIKEAAEVILADDDEDVTVGDLRNLLTTVNQ